MSVMIRSCHKRGSNSKLTMMSDRRHRAVKVLIARAGAPGYLWMPGKANGVHSSCSSYLSRNRGGTCSLSCSKLTDRPWYSEMILSETVRESSADGLKTHCRKPKRRADVSRSLREGERFGWKSRS
jgi:hypothetical protein